MQPRNRIARWGALLPLFLFFLSSCTVDQPRESIPQGAWIHGSAVAASPLLAALSGLEGTPAASWASTLGARIAECGEFIAGGPDTDLASLASSARCSESGDVPPALERLRGSAPVAFALPVSETEQIVGTLQPDSRGGLGAHARMRAPRSDSPMALLIPGEEPPGAPVLSSVDALVHARVRPEAGLDIATRVSEGSQADRLFRLRSEIFLGHVLDGSWELAVYMPEKEQLTPPIALALDYSLRSAAEAGVEKFVADLEATWPIRHAFAEIAGQPGACFHDLRIMPDFEPCYVVTDRSIVIGWNASSLRIALAESGSPGPDDLGAGGGLVVRLGRLPEADLRLREQLGQSAAGRGTRFEWDRLLLEGSTADEEVELRLALDPPRES